MGKPGALVALSRTEYVCKSGDLVQRHRPKCSLAVLFAFPPEAPTHRVVRSIPSAQPTNQVKPAPGSGSDSG